MKTEKDEWAAAWIAHLEAPFQSWDFSDRHVERAEGRAIRECRDDGMLRICVEYLRQAEEVGLPPELWVQNWPGVSGTIGLWLAKHTKKQPDLLAHVQTPKQYAALARIANSVAWHGGDVPDWWTPDLVPRLTQLQALMYIQEITVDQMAERWSDPATIALRDAVKQAGAAPRTIFD